MIIGTSIALTTTAAAICVVASPTNGSHDGSTNATAAGVAIEFPAAVATAHPAYPGRLPITRSHNTMNGPPINTTISPNTIPEIPPLIYSSD